MAAGSEKISLRWIEGAKRECVKCGSKMPNLERDVGVVRTVFPSRRREIICMDCHCRFARETLGITGPETT